MTLCVFSLLLTIPINTHTRASRLFGWLTFTWNNNKEILQAAIIFTFIRSLAKQLYNWIVIQIQQHTYSEWLSFTRFAPNSEQINSLPLQLKKNKKQKKNKIIAESILFLEHDIDLSLWSLFGLTFIRLLSSYWVLTLACHCAVRLFCA